MTFNQPAGLALLGHAGRLHAPGLRGLAAGVRGAGHEARATAAAMHARGLRDGRTATRVADTELRAHAAAATAIRAAVDGARIGIAIDVNRVAPATDSERDRTAAAQWSSARDAWFLDPLFGRG